MVLLAPSAGISVLAKLTVHAPLATVAVLVVVPHTTLMMRPFSAVVVPLIVTPADFSEALILSSVATVLIVTVGACDGAVRLVILATKLTTLPAPCCSTTDAPCCNNMTPFVLKETVPSDLASMAPAKRGMVSDKGPAPSIAAKIWP